MKSFRQRAALRIIVVAFGLATLFGITTYWITQIAFEKAIVKQVVETSNSLKWALSSSAIKGFRKDNSELISQLNNIIKFGSFDAVELYDADWNKLAEADNDVVEEHAELARTDHFIQYTQPIYRAKKIKDGRLAINVFVPYLEVPDDLSSKPLGYFEGLYITPEWRVEQMRNLSYGSVLFVMLAVLISGMALYPIMLDLYREREKKAENLFQSNVLVMKSLGEAIARRDSETGAHNTRVTLLAIAIAEAMKFPSQSMESLIVGALLHDIGKIAISDNILLKPGRLTDAEFEIMKDHVKYGEDIIEDKGWLHDAFDVISGHHERWDGSGYPRGLKGESIPLAARIFTVADVFDALISKRPYKEPFDYQISLAVIDDGTGTHFDPQVVEAFKPISKALYEDLMALNEVDLEKRLDEAIDHYLKISLS